MTEWKEADITINGVNIGVGCSLAFRVAIEVLANDLIENGLGDDEHGKVMVKNYLARIDDIRRAIGVIK